MHRKWRIDSASKMSKQTFVATSSQSAIQKRSIVDVLQELQRQIQVLYGDYFAMAYFFALCTCLYKRLLFSVLLEPRE